METTCFKLQEQVNNTNAIEWKGRFTAYYLTTSEYKRRAHSKIYLAY